MLLRRFRILLLGLIMSAGVAATEQAPDFQHEIAPLLIRRCVECHQGLEPAGGLSLTSEKGWLVGGDSGEVIDQNSRGESYLLKRVIAGEMPPEQHGRSQKLDASEISLLNRWIRSGANWPEGRQLDFLERTNDVRAGRDWWSLQPVERPSVPELEGEQLTSSIDAFVRIRLERAGMQAAPKAAPGTRLRRLYYDLIGLPPTRVETEQFLADPSDAAWEQAIDRLLASPQYGVRWARYWLDVARYADTSGYERDQEKPFAWKYRDWVVDALNSDMAYDQFIIQQLAGDEIDGRNQQSMIATGFMRLGTWNDEPNDPADYVYDRLEDLVHTTSSAFLAMTVKCARCHSHKFDAITQEDYYRVASSFWAGPIKAGDRQELGGPPKETLGYEDVLAWTDLSAKPEPLYLLKNGLRDQPLHEVVPASPSFVPDLERPYHAPANGAKTSMRRLQLATWIAHPKNPLTARVLVNRLWLHHFGNAIVRSPNNFGFLADPPTHPELLDWLAAEFVSGDWRIKRMHKLILLSETWQQASIHPLGTKYRESDAGNRLWWRAERRRLDAETLRDSMLASSGELDSRVGGEGFRPAISNEALEGLSRKAADWSPSPTTEQFRRSLYIYSKRGLLPPIMTTFDMCDTTQSCGQRDSTTAPTQALAMLNNRFVHERGAALARRVKAEHPSLEEQAQAIWSEVLRRKATADELELGISHVTTQQRQMEQERSLARSSEDSQNAISPAVASLASLVHVLMNSNEFIYVD